ncbi:hypothetical protein Hanom_Chr04g00283991 [Helianthus anomalus]
MSFSSLGFGQFCNFRLKVCFSASRSKRLKILLFSSGALTPSIFLRLVKGISVLLVNLKGNSVFFRGIRSFYMKGKRPNCPLS